MKVKRYLIIHFQELVEQSKTHSVFVMSDGEYFKYDTETVQLVVKACVCLYKLLQLTFCTFYGPSGFVDTEL